ncbi:type-2 ice-structuring protein-like [Thalassophryne amazonica]|uniref:type-2 ice-structuring protein-like n=1 Tax=Thalassophryne amazonica TaxID=390379 RepID=UPI0014714FF2|nr:type-2 ice-structuring protein-like [Thalassophryne amazonica]
MKTLTYVCLLICAMMTEWSCCYTPVLVLDHVLLVKLRILRHFYCKNPPEVRVKRASSCPSGWYEISGRCFRYVPRTLSWTGAESNCMSMGGHLASVHSSDEYLDIQNLIIKLIHQYNETWLGGSDLYQEGHWLWRMEHLSGITTGVSESRIMVKTLITVCKLIIQAKNAGMIENVKKSFRPFVLKRPNYLWV